MPSRRRDVGGASEARAALAVLARRDGAGRRGKAVPLRVRCAIVLALYANPSLTQRAAAQMHVVSVSSVRRFWRAARDAVATHAARQRAAAARGGGGGASRVNAARAHGGARRADGAVRDSLVRVLRRALGERARGGDRRSVLSAARHGAFVRALYRAEPDMYLDELQRRVADEFGVRVSVSALWRFVRHRLQLTRQRFSGRALSAQGVSERNMAKRRAFVAEWFGDTASAAALGTAGEAADQRAHWRVRRRWRAGDDADDGAADGRRGAAATRRAPARVVSPDQLYFVDETGVNWHTARRRYGRAPPGSGGPLLPPAHRDADARRGANHSVLLTVGRVHGVVARRVLVGRGRGTRRDDFVAYVSELVAPAMLATAREAGVRDDAPLFLVMDNASIHRGAVVANALAAASPRLHVVYQPPYAPTFNPVELVNAELKRALRRVRGTWAVAADSDADAGGARSTLRALIEHCVDAPSMLRTVAPTTACAVGERERASA